jgi:hypothetical protein
MKINKYKIIIIIIYIYVKFDLISFYLFGLKGKYINKQIFNMILNMKHTNIDINNIPDNLKDKIEIINIKNNTYVSSNKKQFITNIMNNMNDSKLFNNKLKDLTFIDFLDYKLKYSFGPHTDIEWNAIENDGYQVWCLLKNNHPNNYGNMFIIYNEYLFNKYTAKDIYYNLNIENNKITISKNCKLKKQKIKLEELDIDVFKKNTQIYYLNLTKGDCFIFNKQICHMSDPRVSDREAVNFRVIIDGIKLKADYTDIFSCGFLKYKPIKI